MNLVHIGYVEVTRNASREISSLTLVAYGAGGGGLLDS
jgi:hypothetical protein